MTVVGAALRRLSAGTVFPASLAVAAVALLTIGIVGPPDPELAADFSP